MTPSTILPDDEPVSMQSMPTQWGGDPAALGRIDHYDLLRKLGGGGFGVVYLARDTVSDVEVAIKTLHPLIKRNAEEMDLLREKFRLVSRLSHPNIATALVLHPCRDIHIRDEAARQELRLSPGDSVMVMRYAPGVTLSKWRRQFPDGIVPFDLALEIGRQIAAALDYAHGERIVHRDVKPGNVMVETTRGEGSHAESAEFESHAESAENAEFESHAEFAESAEFGGASRPGEPQLVTRHPSLVTPRIRVRILDFGLAAEIRSSMSRVSTETGDTSGTRPYMAPEQWLGRKQDGRTDQYALACVLYELLSGAPPFAGVFETGDPVIMRTAVTTDTPEEIDGLNPATNVALLRALAKAPKDRFPSCAAFVDTLSRAENEPRAESAVTPVPPRPGASVPHLESHAESAEGAAVSGRARSPSGPPEVASETWQSGAALVVCPVCGRKNRPEDTFRCRGCGRDNLCLRHQDENSYLCADCDAAETERKRQEEAERKAREEAEREEAERRVHEEVERRKAQETKPGELKTVEVSPGVPMNFRWCPATTSEWWKSISGGEDFFWMGSPNDEEDRFDEENRHPVRLTRGFWMGETPVTQSQWEALMGENPSHFLDRGTFFGVGRKTSPQRPVESVSWDHCQVFLRKLNAKVSEAGRFALPSEAQWEYACRAGTTGTYGGTGRLDDMGWYSSNSGGETHPVAQKGPNDWGLHDMHGNVWEWCADWYGPYPRGSVTDPAGPSSGSFRVSRGGSWRDLACGCRSASRNGAGQGGRDDCLGFRVALVPAQERADAVH